jgi:sugar O-acyltransferase (sialic acid O-acetyltransferase NeuD family)
MRIILLGASGHARVIIDSIERAGEHQVAGLVAEDDNGRRSFFGYPLLGGLAVLAAVVASHNAEALVAAVGDNDKRAAVVRRVSEMLPATPFVKCIHPSAQIGRCVEIGEGTVVMAGAVINSGTQVGRYCIVNTAARVDHDSVLGDFVSVAPGATLGGNVHVGEYSAISLGASVIHGITIGHDTVIGAGAVVVRNVEGNVVAYGVPARVVRQRERSDRYL